MLLSQSHTLYSVMHWKNTSFKNVGNAVAVKCIALSHDCRICNCIVFRNIAVDFQGFFIHLFQWDRNIRPTIFKAEKKQVKKTFTVTRHGYEELNLQMKTYRIACEQVCQAYFVE